MHEAYLLIKESKPLFGTAHLYGAKNAVLVMMASLILTKGKSILTNVPFSSDIKNMMQLLQNLGAEVKYISEMQLLSVDTSGISHYEVDYELMKKMRASVLVMGPLLARFGKAHIALPGGCLIGERPINYHLQSFKKLGVSITHLDDRVDARVAHLQPAKIILDYPSVGATENILMLAALIKGTTRIVNAALEPEVLDFITLLTKMGARIAVLPPATIEIEGVDELSSVEHAVLYDRLEAGTLLLGAAVSGGTLDLPQAPAFAMELFLQKLQEMGHEITIGAQEIGVSLRACKNPKAVSFKTGPHPSFPTDLQAPMMVAQTIADGTSLIEETVFENRFLHVRELQKMGAQIEVQHNKATIKGVDRLYAQQVIATDIRASCALVLAGLIAQGTTLMTGVQHWKRGYDNLETKLNQLGASIKLIDEQPMHAHAMQIVMESEV